MNRSCPICLNSSKDLLYKQNFNNKVITTVENYDVVVCSNCGFVYADKIPTQLEFNKYYAEMSKYEFNYDKGVVSNKYIEHFTKIFNFLNPCLTDKNAKILDIGCSTGALLSIFKSRGYSNLLGLDPSPSCVKTVKKLYKIKAVADNISHFKTKKKFDLIILSAVLEHLVDLKKSLRKIHSLLNKNGLLFIEVPDIERFASYIFTPFQQFSIEHINYFSQYSLKNLLSLSYFEVIKMKKDKNEINQSLDPDFFILARKSKKNIFTKDSSSLKKIKTYINKCSKLDSQIKKKIQKIQDANKIIVWGTGTHTQRLIGSGLELSKILYFVDTNTKYWGKKINGKEIKSPNDIKENIPILISTYSYQDEIVHQIKNLMRLKNKILTLY